MTDTRDLPTLAIGWLTAAHRHREASGLCGKVQVTLHRTPAGLELQLLEETTFKRSGRSCPYRDAVAWMAEKEAQRAAAGHGGKLLMETDYRDGTATWAKVLEITTISVSSLDGGPPLR